MISETSKNSQGQALEERLSNMHEQMAGVTSRLDQTERDLDLERATREDIIKAEVERRMREAEQRIREEVEAEYADERAAIDNEKKAINQQRADMQKSFEQMTQQLQADVANQIRKAKEAAQRESLAVLARQTENFMQIFANVVNGTPSQYEELLGKFQTASVEAKSVLSKEVQEKLEQAAKKGNSRARQIAELVRMFLTQKRERFIISEDDRVTVHEQILASIEESEEDKERYKIALSILKEHRLRKEAERVLRRENHQDGHGRSLIPADMPRLPEIIIYPDECIGHLDEYREVYPGEVQEFIVPVSAKYMVQGYRCPVMVRKGDINEKMVYAPIHEELIWKSNASNKLLSQMEVRKFVDHMPFYRQIKQMEKDGLSLSRSTINDWHADVCEALRPLYELQIKRTMSSRYLAADGSPMPVVNNEKHRTVKQYIIEYRSIDTGIPIFLTTPGKGSGRGKEVIQSQLSEWNGLALMCDAYPGYDWIKKIGRILCRCSAHARRDMERAQKEDPKGALPGMVLFNEIYGVEEIIKREGATGADKLQIRHDLAKPLWESFFLWCSGEIIKHDQNSQMHKALNYVIRHYDELTAYLDIPEMPLDNNDTERQIRSMVMGKKAYLFCQNDTFCEYAAMMYSFFGACKVKGRNEERWLTYVLDHIKNTKEEDLYKLLPEFWEDIN